MSDLNVLKQKLQKVWQSKKVHQNYLQQGELFPYTLKIKKYPAKQMLSHFQTIQRQYSALTDFAKTHKYQLNRRPLSLNKLGEQNIPDAFVLSEQDLIAWLGKKQEWSNFKKLCQHLKTYPRLKPLFKQQPFLLMQYQDVFSQLLSVIDWFINTTDKHVYIRQISIKNIDTKFIESHKKILSLMLDCCLDKTQINQNYKGIVNHQFEQRYGLRYESKRIRLRLLDKAINIQGINDIEIPITSFKSLSLNINTVYITENKINGLCFPAKPKSMVIFGLGYSIKTLAAAKWLKQCQIKYWGDIDTHGFTILSQLREVLPHTESILMDKNTLLAHKKSWVVEAKQQINQTRLNHLTTAEQALYQKLINNHYGVNIRLEQELIDYEILKTI